MSVCIYIIQVQSSKFRLTLLNKSNAGHFNLIRPTLESFRKTFLWLLFLPGDREWECNMIGDQEDCVECWAADIDRLPLTYFNHISLVDITPQHKHHLPENNPRKEEREVKRFIQVYYYPWKWTQGNLTTILYSLNLSATGYSTFNHSLFSLLWWSGICPQHPVALLISFIHLID